MWGGQGPGWGGGGSGGWPNQAAVQAMPHGAVDWAALAQQWIQMKGDGSGGHPPPMTPSFPHQNAPRPPAPEIPRFQGRDCNWINGNQIKLVDNYPLHRVYCSREPL